MHLFYVYLDALVSLCGASVHQKDVIGTTTLVFATTQAGERRGGEDVAAKAEYILPSQMKFKTTCFQPAAGSYKITTSRRSDAFPDTITSPLQTTPQRNQFPPLSSNFLPQEMDSSGGNVCSHR
ncbi:hypothetical protein Bbelb_233110 [Branchiostoma belcheri]|nr:hypothetical protein Bbelb_233110 [Branchiostoma belcheri]